MINATTESGSETSPHALDHQYTNLAPILPHSPVQAHRTQRLHAYLGYEGQLFGTQQVVEYQEEARHGGLRSHRALTYNHSSAVGTWAPLFKKLDESVIEEEYARFEG